MTTTINEKGELQIDIGDLLKAISAESKQDLIDHLSCDEEILRKVSEQLTEGYWDDGEGFWHGSSTVLNEARVNIGLRANDIAEKEITRLQKELADLQTRYWKEVEENAIRARNNR